MNMKCSIRRTPAMLAGVLFLAWMLVPASALAQRGRGSGWGPNSAYNRLYNNATIETLSGTVVSVDRFTAQRGGSYGIHVVMKAGDETVPVHLGPGWYVENQEAAIQEGDAIEVTGSRITFEGQPAIIAAEVRRGGETLRLRDQNGFPVWHGWRRQR